MKSRAKKALLSDEEIKAVKQRKIILFGQIIVGVLLVLLWQLASNLKWIDSYYWSSPGRIIQAAIIQFREKDLLGDIIFTSSSTILGFVLGTLGGACLGLSFWWSKTYAGIAEPYLVLFNAVPKLALAPILIIILGIGFSSKVVLAFMMTVVTCALSTFSGVKSVDHSLETLLYSLGANRFQVFAKVVVPSTLPWIISSLRINIALSLAGAIVGEFIASSRGLGRMVIYAGTILDTTLVWVGVVSLSILSILMYLCVVQLEKWLMKHLAFQNI